MEFSWIGLYNLIISNSMHSNWLLFSYFCFITKCISINWATIQTFRWKWKQKREREKCTTKKLNIAGHGKHNISIANRIDTLTIYCVQIRWCFFHILVAVKANYYLKLKKKNFSFLCVLFWICVSKSISSLMKTVYHNMNHRHYQIPVINWHAWNNIDLCVNFRTKINAGICWRQFLTCLL